jgi:hypothetical protein
MRRAAVAATTIVVGGLVLAATWFVATTAENAHDKAIFAALQGVEADSRTRILNTPLVLMDGGDAGEVLGVSTTTGDFPYCWVSLTKTSAAGDAMALDCGKWTSRCRDVEAVLHGRPLPSPVHRLISKRCAAT